MLKPLHQLLCHDKAWKWTEQCEQAFTQTKTALLESNVLTHFDPKLPLQLACDASPYGVGAVVSHIMPSGEERPIAFASRTLSKAESNYAQIEREALGIVFGVRKFHQYLFWEEVYSPNRSSPPHNHIRAPYWHSTISSQQDAKMGFIAICSHLRHQVQKVRATCKCGWSLQVTPTCWT